MKAKINPPATTKEARIATIRAILKLENATRGQLQGTILKFAELLIEALADCPNADTRRFLEMGYVCFVLDVHRGCRSLTDGEPPTDTAN